LYSVVPIGDNVFGSSSAKWIHRSRMRTFASVIANDSRLFLRGAVLSFFLHKIARKVLPLAGFLALAAPIAPSQAMLSSSRGAEIAPFAQTTLLSPDWGPTKDLGYTIGIDYTRFIRSIVQPSIEVRMTSASGSSVNERTYSGGLKLQTTIHHVRPYATFLVGNGTIQFVHPINNYLSDNSIIYSLGGGAEVDVTSQLSVRFDFQHQQWNLDPNTLTPVALGVGFSYRLPFHSIGVH
jgi:hypothetical protein